MGCTNFAMIVGIKLLLVSWKTEITKFDSPVVSNKHILTFKITVEQMAFVQVEQGHGNLLPNTHYLGIIKHEFTLVKEIEKTALVDELCDHVEVRLMV